MTWLVWLNLIGGACGLVSIGIQIGRRMGSGRRDE